MATYRSFKVKVMLPKPQLPRELTHVGLSQHELKLVLQHYPVCVNMGGGVQP